VKQSKGNKRDLWVLYVHKNLKSVSLAPGLLRSARSDEIRVYKKDDIVKYFSLVIISFFLSACGKKGPVEPLKPGEYPRTYPKASVDTETVNKKGMIS